MKQFAWVVISLLTGLLLSACHVKTEEPTVVVAGGYNAELASLFPNIEGTSWTYYGTADYAQHMKVDKTYETSTQKVISVTGEVDDLSGGASDKDFSLEVNYKISSDRVVQTKLSDVMMDSEYDKLTLIMSPLAKGTTWEESVIDSQGKKVKLKGEIIEVDDDEKGKIYKVRYEEEGSDYSEVRRIQAGRGVIDFIKTLKYQDQSMELSYHLYELKQAVLSPDSTVNASDIDQIKGTIFKFDELWVDFVNQGNKDILNYVKTDSPVRKMIDNYVKDQSKYKYLSIEVGKVSIVGSEAFAEVYEKMQQESNGSTEVFEYRWQYKLVKQGEQWLIHSYEAISE